MTAARLDARCYEPLLRVYRIEFIIKFLLTRYWRTDKSSEIGRLELCPQGFNHLSVQTQAIDRFAFEQPGHSPSRNTSQLDFLKITHGINLPA